MEGCVCLCAYTNSHTNIHRDIYISIQNIVNWYLSTMDFTNQEAEREERRYCNSTSQVILEEQILREQQGKKNIVGQILQSRGRRKEECNLFLQEVKLEVKGIKRSQNAKNQQYSLKWGFEKRQCFVLIAVIVEP